MKPVAELLTECSVRLGDSARTIWSAAELLRYANDAALIIHRESLCLFKQVYLNDQVGEVEAQLPSDCLMVDRVVWGGIALDIVTTGRLRRMDHQYRILSGSVYAVGLDGMNKLMKFRAPVASITSTNPDAHSPTTTLVNNTRLEYFSNGPTLTATGAVDLPNSYAKYMRQYILWKSYEREGPGQNALLAAHYEQRWEMGLARLRDIRGRLQSARDRRLGRGGRRHASPAKPVMPPEYGRIVRG